MIRSACLLLGTGLDTVNALDDGLNDSILPHMLRKRAAA